jgi:ribosomal protein S27AE
MAMSLDKRTHWYVVRTKLGQRMRFCNNATTGTFVTDNTNASRHQVDCSKCITRMAKVAA